MSEFFGFKSNRQIFEYDHSTPSISSISSPRQSIPRKRPAFVYEQYQNELDAHSAVQEALQQQNPIQIMNDDDQPLPSTPVHDAETQTIEPEITPTTPTTPTTSTIPVSQPPEETTVQLLRKIAHIENKIDQLTGLVVTMMKNVVAVKNSVDNNFHTLKSQNTRMETLLCAEKAAE